jgi:ABC-type dipeptide/oligopeptide/nickel transport system ATPase subunit
VVKAEGVRLSYGGGGLLALPPVLEVLKGIDLELRRGETLGLVGESGCGKSTLARIIAGLIPMTGGRVTMLGQDIATLDPAAWRAMRRQVQLVFQNPFGALNPRRRVGAIIGDPFRIHGVAVGADRKREVRRLMEIVGLNPEHYNRFPSEFSGGQRQRIGIARALALNPALIILDEPVSALDVSIQAQVLNLMRSLQKELGLTYLFISHDLAWFGTSATASPSCMAHDRRARRCRDAVCRPAALLHQDAAGGFRDAAAAARVRRSPAAAFERDGRRMSTAIAAANQEIMQRGSLALTLRRLARDPASLMAFSFIVLLVVFTFSAPLLAAWTGHTPIEQYRETGLSEMGLPVAPNRRIRVRHRPARPRRAGAARLRGQRSLTVGVLASLARR